MTIDPPTPEFTFVPTTAYELHWVRSYGQAFCLDNGLDEVDFVYSFSHQWEKHVTVTAQGFVAVNEGLDASPEQERSEVERIHNGR